MQRVNPLTQSYVPIAFMVGMSVMTGVGILVLSWLLSGRRRSSAGETIYECGLDPMDDPSKRFAVRFHVVAMLFILFDVEVALLYPWAVFFGGHDTAAPLRLLAFVELLVFLALLFGGYVYLYRIGAFDWAKEARRRLAASGSDRERAA